TPRVPIKGEAHKDVRPPKVAYLSRPKSLLKFLGGRISEALNYQRRLRRATLRLNPLINTASLCQIVLSLLRCSGSRNCQ
ncbi:MAG: hypothetical protein ACK4I8_11865, partial [Armatimonadota bacterium]